MKYTLNRGLSLIEVIIYIGLLSILISSLIQYMFVIHQKDEDIRNKVNDEYMKGFAGIVAVIIVSVSLFLFVIVNSIVVNQYSDSISQKELRIQSQINMKSCIERVKAFINNDRFLTGNIEFREYGCGIEIENVDSSSFYNLSLVTTLQGVKSYEKLTIQVKR